MLSEIEIKFVGQNRTSFSGFHLSSMRLPVALSSLLPRCRLRIFRPCLNRQSKLQEFVCDTWFSYSHIQSNRLVNSPSTHLPRTTYIRPTFIHPFFGLEEQTCAPICPYSHKIDHWHPNDISSWLFVNSNIPRQPRLGQQLLEPTDFKARVRHTLDAATVKMKSLSIAIASMAFAGLLPGVVGDLCALGSQEIDGNWFCQAVKGIQYTNVGTPGSYNQVVYMGEDGTCSSRPKSFSGSMSPLDEEVSRVDNSEPW